jgi:PAS domain S-box-containing protein
LPLVKQVSLVGILYLENSLAPRVFTPKRLDMLEMLASQAAISLDHARLYADLNRLNAELRRSEAYLAEGEKISHTASWAWNVATGEAYWSQEHFRIFGFDPEKAMPSYPMFLQRIHPEDRGRAEQTIDRAVRERSDFIQEYRLVLPDGSIKYVHTVGHPVVNESGVFEFIGTAMDVTDRVQAEEELRQSEASLRKAQTELAHVSRVTTMGELAASIAHEVNQPLGAIANNVNACLRLLASGSENLQEVEGALSDIVKGVDRVSSIIVRMRALAKKAPPEMAQLHIEDVVTDVLTLIHHELTRRHVAIHRELTKDLPPILGDRIQLQQVLLNLIMNGVEAMNEVAGGERRISIRARRHEHNGRPAVLVSVQDSGVGLKPGEVDRLFEAFYTTKAHGIGMGLAISRSIVEAHGGRLWIAPADGPGATFEFILPAKS